MKDIDSKATVNLHRKHEGMSQSDSEGKLKPTFDVPRSVIEDFRKGSHEAYREIFEFYSKAVRNFISSFRLADDLLEDIVQEVFITLWERREHVDPEKGLLNYVFYLSRNTAVDRMRRAHMQNRFLQDVELDFAPEADADILHEQTQLLIDIIVSSMPSQRQKIFKMSRQDGLSIEDIARELNISNGNVRTQLHYAIKDIKELLPILIAML